MIGISVQDLGVVLSIMGATMSCLVILLLPGIFYYRLAMKSLSSGSSATSSSVATGKRSTAASTSYAPVSLMLPSNHLSSHGHQPHHQSGVGRLTSYFSSTMQRVQDYLEEGVELLHRRSSVSTSAAGTQLGASSMATVSSVVDSPLPHIPRHRRRYQRTILCIRSLVVNMGVST